ncbi:MAG TPA: tetratricopeptide repeat protein, partial [Chitinivibrionales bacterium]
MDDFPELPDLVDKIEEFLELGLFDEGLKLLDRYGDLYNDEWEIHFLYSRIHLERNNPAAAIRYLHDALKIDKNNVDCLLGLFYAHSQMGQLKKCGKYLFKAEKFYPESEPVMSALIWYYTETNDLQRATA